MGYEWRDGLRGAEQGARMGSFGGPIGTLIGAVAGGTLGGFGDYFGNRINVDSFGAPNFLSPEELQRQNSMQSFDWSNILKMLGSAGTTGSDAEQAQPTMGGMLQRNPSYLPPIAPQPTRGEGSYQTWLQKNNLV